MLKVNINKAFLEITGITRVTIKSTKVISFKPSLFSLLFLWYILLRATVGFFIYKIVIIKYKKTYIIIIIIAKVKLTAFILIIEYSSFYIITSIREIYKGISLLFFFIGRNQRLKVI